jgi:small subunit ribosomal protein S16
MALTIRMQRHGAKGQPFFRLVVCEKAARRDGRFVEILGTYNPRPGGKDSAYKLNMPRIDHWLKVGAKPSDTAWSMIKLARKDPQTTEAAAPVAQA